MTREPLSPLTPSEQIREVGWMLLTLMVSFPASITLAYFARFESWPDLSFLIGGL